MTDKLSCSPFCSCGWFIYFHEFKAARILYNCPMGITPRMGNSNHA
jgi:hypothetical protein